MEKLIYLLALMLAASWAQADFEWAYQALEETLIHFDDAPRTAPGSSKSYTQTQIDDPFSPPDWFPDDHEPMPEVVARGMGEQVRACAQCHLTSGMGHPESSQLAGLSLGYMLRQMADFKSGARKDRFWMNPISAALPEEDWQTALRYYATIEPIDWVDVIETDTVPKNYVGKGRMRFVHPDGGTEPLGNRILEFPEDPDLVHLRYPYSGFIAYAPLGSVARGKDLATTGDSGKTITCHICHGEGLKGLGEVPAIAGMSPLYVVRQLNDIKTGARAGISAALMQATVANLTEEDIVALAAYLASLDP
ncbi:MAG: c-type cytochrome [Gammaproteobacteria bacterium]